MPWSPKRLAAYLAGAVIDRYPGLRVTMRPYRPRLDFTNPAVRHAAFDSRESLNVALLEAWRQHCNRTPDA